MSIFRYELKQYRRALFLWPIILGVFMLIFLQVFVSMLAGEIESMSEIFQKNAFFQAMGLDFSVFLSKEGMFSYLHGFLLVAAAIQAMNLGLSILGKETARKTADFLLTKPNSRPSIWGQKALSCLISILITSTVYTGFCFLSLGFAANWEFDAEAILLICLTFPMLQILYCTLGLLIAALVPRIPNVLPVSIGTAFLTYCLGMVSNLADSTVARAVSPFRYFPTNYILEHRAYEWGYAGLFLLLTVIFGCVSFAAFCKKDIAA